MTIRPLLMRAGVVKDDTELSSAGYATDSDRIVWHMGRAQCMQGSQQKRTGLQGYGRCALELAANDGTPMLALGTSKKLYVLRGSDLFDATPERTSGTLGSNPLATTSGSSTVVVTHNSHGLATGDTAYIRGSSAVAGLQLSGISGTLGASLMVTTAGSTRIQVNHVGHGLSDNHLAYFTSATTFGGIPAAEINTALGHRVIVFSPDSYFIWVPSTATSSATGGGTPTYAYAKPYVVTVINGNSYSINAGANANATTTGGGASIGYSYELTIGRTSGGFSLGGYGAGPYGAGPYGIGSGTQQAPSKPRSWTMGAFGQFLIANIIGGAIYSWNGAAPSARAIVVTNAPAQCNAVVVTPERSIVAFGCTDTNGLFDPNLIRHTEPEAMTTWVKTTTNGAGVERASYGGSIVAAKVTSYGTIFWTQNSMYELRWIGSLDQVYKPEILGRGSGICGPHAMCEISDTLYWLDPSFSLFAFTGGRPYLQQFPMNRYLMESIDKAQADKVYGFPDTDYPAACWLYPGPTTEGELGIAGECNRYLRFDVHEARGDPLAGWSCGRYDRSFWSTKEVWPNPMAMDSSGNLYDHNLGYAEGDGGPQYSTVRWGGLEYGDEGQSSMHINRFIMDTARSDAMTVTVDGIKWPEDTGELASEVFTIPPATSIKDIQVQARQFAMRFEFECGTFWRLGLMRYDVSQGPKRDA